jgi:hypothetical protein
MNAAQLKIAACQTALAVDANGNALLNDGIPGDITQGAWKATCAAALAPVASPAPTPSPGSLPTFPYSACIAAVADKGSPPASFIDTIIAGVKALPDAAVGPKPVSNIFSALARAFGDPQDTLTRKAIMCEGLRVVAAFESGWDWNCSADTTAGPETPSETESGAFQASQNSESLDPTGGLAAFLDSKWGAHDAAAFIRNMKTDHITAVQYAAMLFDWNTKWDGPVNRGWVTSNVSAAAVAEFKEFLQA